MQISFNHQTTYQYDHPVSYALQQLRLHPKSESGQSIVDWVILVEGGRVECEFQDHNQNHAHLISIEPGRGALEIECEGTVELSNNAGVVGKHTGFTPLWYYQRSTELTNPGPTIRKFARMSGSKHSDHISRMHALSSSILAKIKYETGTTDADTTAENSLKSGSGVCQDHTHVFITIARLFGYPARYVSGYLMLENSIEQNASHAWAEVHLEGLGWVGFDVSNGISPDDRYVRIATGLDYREAAPVSGIWFGGGKESMTVKLQVQQQ